MTRMKCVTHGPTCGGTSKNCELVYDEDLFDEDYGHDPDLDENGVCRVCGKFEPE
jgi:hypothetical protein